MWKFSRKWIGAVNLLLLGSLQVIAQLPCKVEHYSTDNGLSHDIITCMYKDHDGYMWFGTWGGINRFDGQNFTPFKSMPGDNSQLTNNRVDQIMGDDLNHLWMKGYDGEIYQFDKGTGQFMSLSSILHLKKKIFFNHILLANTSLWISTVNEGVILIPDLRKAPGVYVHFKQEKNSNRGLPSNTINFFYKDQNSTFWIGTNNGLAWAAKSPNGRFILQKLDIPTGVAGFTTAAEEGNRLYFGTSDGALVVVDAVERTIINRIELTKDRLWAMLVSKDKSKIFVTTSGGELITVNCLDYHLARSVYSKDNRLFSIFQDSKNNLWFEPEKRGVVRYDIAKNIFTTYTQRNDAKLGIPDNHFRVFEDNVGRVWSVLRDGGFGYYNPAANKLEYFYNEPDSRDRKFSNLVATAFYDNAGVLWLHTDEHGLEKVVFEPDDFKQHLVVNPGTFKSDNDVRGLLFDSQKRLWVGVKSNHLYLFQNGHELHYTFENVGKDIGMVYTAMEDKNGVIWLGTKANGLYKAEPLDKTFLRYKLTHFEHNAADQASISSNEIYSLLEDRQGNIWVGTFDQGLNLLVIQNGSLKFQHFADGKNGYPMRFQKIRHLALDAKGNLWIATTDGLVVGDIHQATKSTFQTFIKQPGDYSSLGNNDVQYVYRDHLGRMWLATSGGGLDMAVGNPFHGGLKFKVYTTEDGLANDYVLSCTEDKNHNLWVASKSGLSRFDVAKKKFKNYISDQIGLNLSFSEGSCANIDNGEIVFGTQRGYLSFNPDQIRVYPINANMVFTNLQVNNTDVPIRSTSGILSKNINNTKSIELKYNQNIISVDYAILDYRSSDRQSYSYRLLGFDPVWHDNKTQLRATYTNLPPGNYTFEVRSIDKEKYINVPGKSLAITILPPPWKTWWAYALYAVIAAFIIEGIRRTTITMLSLRHKIAVEHKLAELKLEFFTNVSHELRTPLTLILNPAEEIFKHEKLSPQGYDYIAIVRRNANRMVRFVNQLLDLRKVQSGKAKLSLSYVELVSFIKEVSAHFEELKREKHISFTVNSSNAAVYAWIDADKIETVLYNLISNAYKFTPVNRKITVNIRTDYELVFIEVKDEGCGVVPEELKLIFELYHEGKHPESAGLKGSGIGLALAKDLVELHKGQINAVNNPRGGLSVTVQLPIAANHIIAASNDNAIDARPGNKTVDEALINEEEFMPEASVMASAPFLLLVEDNTDMRSFLKSQLGGTYRVEVAENGVLGLKMAQEKQPDLILSDIMMPEMDGIEMLYHLKNDVVTSHIPVVLLSAKNAIENQIKGLQYGADFYISKPFDNELLFAAVANILTKRKNYLDSITSDRKLVELSPGEVVVTSKDELFLKKVISIVEEKMADPDFNIDIVADLANMARATFYKKFKSLTQLAPVEFVREMRLKRAKQLFDANSGGNIAEVAYTVGFSSAKYFSTCFKAQYQISPSDYVKNIKPANYDVI
ncbi:MAG TPA: two-component regulator propeller domain-containing protein [Mucilaginibacter sp.]|jgi:signal transduction histidine kinase/ligand-binding sensor domain-containing protein/AraC-like DNA-binding protein